MQMEKNEIVATHRQLFVCLFVAILHCIGWCLMRLEYRSMPLRRYAPVRDPTSRKLGWDYTSVDDRLCRGEWGTWAPNSHRPHDVTNLSLRIHPTLCIRRAPPRTNN